MSLQSLLPESLYGKKRESSHRPPVTLAVATAAAATPSTPTCIPTDPFVAMPLASITTTPPTNMPYWQRITTRRTYHHYPHHTHPQPTSLIPATAYQVKEQKPLGEVLKNAGRKALGGGIPGMIAMGINVLSLMWLRTTINYQYRYGLTTTQALKKLYAEGGIVRFYRGLGPALIQGPVSRFGDTAANTGVLALLESYPATATLPVGIKTLAASASAATFRIFLMPVDALKTIMQVEGKNGFPALVNKVKLGGPSVLYHGALAASAASLAGHYPWFFTYNTLNERIPQYPELHKKLLRSAVIGFCASAVSDTISNSIRVVKTTRQTATVPMTYPEVVRTIVASDGVLGLMGRGLKTKILANGLQGLMFSVLWRLGQDWWNRNEKKEE